MMRRIVTLAVLAALAMPVLLDRDSYPLSTYPMYSRQRSSTISFVVASGVRADGERIRLGLDIVGGSDDPLIVSALTRQAAADGPEGTARLCARIAARLRSLLSSTGSSSAHSEAAAAPVAVEVVRETHDTVARATGSGGSLLTAEELARCPLEAVE